MHVERPSPLAAATDMESVRREATRNRVISEEWAGHSMSDLLTTVGAIASLPQGTPTPTYQVRLSEVLCICDNLLMAGEVAATSIQIIAEERLQLAKQTADTDASVAREEVEVQRLRKLLERERRVVDHRKQLDGLANVILQYPTRTQFSEQFEQAGLAARNVDQQVERLQSVRDCLSKELSLLVSCAAGVQLSAKQMDHLFSEPVSRVEAAEETGDAPGGNSGMNDLLNRDSADPNGTVAAPTSTAGSASGEAPGAAPGAAGVSGVDRTGVDRTGVDRMEVS